MDKTMNKTDRHAKMGVYAYPYRRLDMFDCWNVTEQEGTETNLLKRLDEIADTYARHGYKVKRFKVSRSRIQETHSISVSDVHVKKFNKRMKALHVSVWIDL